MTGRAGGPPHRRRPVALLPGEPRTGPLGRRWQPGAGPAGTSRPGVAGGRPGRPATARRPTAGPDPGQPSQRLRSHPGRPQVGVPAGRPGRRATAGPDATSPRPGRPRRRRLSGTPRHLDRPRPGPHRHDRAGRGDLRPFRERGRGSSSPHPRGRGQLGPWRRWAVVDAGQPLDLPPRPSRGRGLPGGPAPPAGGPRPGLRLAGEPPGPGRHRRRAPASHRRGITAPPAGGPGARSRPGGPPRPGHGRGPHPRRPRRRARASVAATGGGRGSRPGPGGDPAAGRGADEPAGPRSARTWVPTSPPSRYG